jgi:phosphate transport system permease protein
MNREARLKKRYTAEQRFKLYGAISILTALFFVGLLLFKVFSGGATAFIKTTIAVEVDYSRELLGFETSQTPSIDDLKQADFYNVTYQAATSFYKFSNDAEEKFIRTLLGARYEREIKNYLFNNPDVLGKKEILYLTTSDDVDQLHKGNFPRDIPEERRRINNFQLQVYDALVEQGKIKTKFNNYFFTHGDSRDSEIAGIAGSMVGSFFSIIICLILAFPIAILAAVYLEEFAPKNRITEIIEINVNNLAAVPSIVFGLLALGILLNVFGLPRSTSLVGGITLSLMTLPTIIIACRASLKAVPPSIREAALAVGASKVQTTFHHVVPLAMPGTLSGTIIGLAQALGETAPLLLIGMVAFVVDVPSVPTDPSASLPVQIYLWSEQAERGFVEKTSATIMVLIGFLIIMNSLAVWARQKFEKKWM